MNRFTDKARFWRSPLLPDAELLTAEYYQQEFAPHWHDGYAIPVIQSGAQSYWYRGSSCLAGASCIAAINPGEVHTGERATEQGWAYRAFYPSLEWMQNLASQIAGHPVATPWLVNGVIHDPQLAAELTRAHRLLEWRADPLAAESALLAAFGMLLQRHSELKSEPGVLSADERRVGLLREKLAQELSSTLSLSDLATVVDLSPFHAARLFSRTVGMPPHAWRNQLRLSRAQDLLRHGMALADVATAVGFSDQSHFNRHFKRAFGAPPGRWQRGQ